MAITKLVITGNTTSVGISSTPITISLAHKAQSTSVVPDDNITATNVQDALEQLDDIKAPIASPDFTGTATFNNASFGDNNKAQFGAGNDLQIYSDGTHSRIYESGSGLLVVRASNFNVNTADGSESYITMQDGGGVASFYNGEQKLATTSTGINVTGTATMDGLTVDGNTGVTIRSDAVGANEPKLVFDNDTFSGASHAQIQTGNGGLQLLIESPSTSTFQNRHQLLLNGGGGKDVTFKLSTNNGTSYKNQLKINNNDISFYEDTGTTPKLFWDASAESLGIGTTSPDYELDISQTSNASPVGLRIQNSEGSFILRTNGNETFMDAGADILFRNSSETERMRIDSSGNVGIGTTSPTNTLNVRGASTNGAGSTGNVALLQGPSGTNGLKIFVDDTENAAGLQTIATDDLLLNPHGGNVGIGTSSPDNTLHVVAGADGEVAQFTGSIANRGLSISIETATDASALTRFNAQSGGSAGQIAFATDSNERMRIDASGNVGIGTTSPASKLEIAGGASGTDVDILRVAGTNSALNVTCSDLSINNPVWTLRTFTGEALAFGDGTDENMRIDSSGNLLVGTTADVTSTNAGVQLRADNTMRIAKTDGAAQSLYRLNSNGDIINFYKDGSSIGSIGARASTAVYIDSKGTTGTAGLDIDVAIAPRKDGALSDGQIDLGTSAYRFEDLYLSGGVHLGGTGSANKLDDYEEGTWTPVASGYAGTLTVNSAAYTKIGRLVHLRASVTFSDTADGSIIQISGVPFAQGSASTGRGGSVTRDTSGSVAFTDGSTSTVLRMLSNTHSTVTYTAVRGATVEFFHIYDA